MLPVVTQPPKFGVSEWQRAGTAADLIEVARAAESAGYRYLCAPEHVALPVSREGIRGSVYWCPLSTLGLLAGATHRISLVTFVLVLGYHHPLDIAKRVGTLDRLSSGRAVLGVGVGSLVEEFALLGAPFDDRGARADDSLAALRAALGQRIPVYQGRYVRFDGMIVDPGLRADLEIWVGGQGARSLRRAIKFADVWAPFGIPRDEVLRLLGDARMADALAARKRPLRVVLYPSIEEIDPLGNPRAVGEDLAAMHEAGVAAFIPHFVNRSRGHFIEQVHALAEISG